MKKRCVLAIIFIAAFIHPSSCTTTLYEPRSPLVPGVVFSELGNLRNLGVIDKGREFDWIVVAGVVGDNASELNGNLLGRKATKSVQRGERCNSNPFETRTTESDPEQH